MSPVDRRSAERAPGAHYRVRDRRVVPLHVYAGTGLAGSSELFIPRGCFMNNIIYIVGVIVIVIAVLSFFGFR